MQLHRVLFDVAPPVDAPSKPQAPHAAAAPRSGAAVQHLPASTAAATPGNTRHIGRKRRVRKRGKTAEEEEKGFLQSKIIKR